ncbi:hypothetical protein [Facilibium subflavum]|uniref:hypothetical protein n=1 Tax=Facilibium subflavum TaxID=2219058 RepID=UPI000E651A25|nr:hypothetical protein [Facilibium subflavum]
METNKNLYRAAVNNVGNIYSLKEATGIIGSYVQNQKVKETNNVYKNKFSMEISNESRSIDPNVVTKRILGNSILKYGNCDEKSECCGLLLMEYLKIAKLNGYIGLYELDGGDHVICLASTKNLEQQYKFNEKQKNKTQYKQTGFFDGSFNKKYEWIDICVMDPWQELHQDQSPINLITMFYEFDKGKMNSGIKDYEGANVRKYDLKIYRDLYGGNTINNNTKLILYTSLVNCGLIKKVSDMDLNKIKAKSYYQYYMKKADKK